MEKYKAVLVVNNVDWVKGDVLDYIYGPERLALIGRRVYGESVALLGIGAFSRH